MGASRHFVAVQRFGRKKGKHDVGGMREHYKRLRIVRETMGIDQAARGFVRSVCRERIVFVKLRRDGLGIAPHEVGDFLLRGVVTRRSVGARQARHILSERVAGNIAGHILRGVEVLRPAVPSAHRLARCGQACLLAERLQQGIVVEREKVRMVGAELLKHGAVEQANVAVVELLQPCRPGESRRRRRVGAVADGSGSGSGDRRGKKSAARYHG